MVLGKPDAETKVRAYVSFKRNLGQLNPVFSFFAFPSVAAELGVLVEQYGPIVSLRRGSHVIIVIGRMDVHLSVPVYLVRSRSLT